MKSLITIILLFAYTFVYPQKFETSCGPNIGYLTNLSTGGPQFGLSIRSTNKYIYIQPELNITCDNELSKAQEMRIPILVGGKIEIFRANLGVELRSDLQYKGNKMGLNLVNYGSTPSIVTPIIGTGINLGYFSIDFRVTSDSFKKVNLNNQYMISASYFFPMKNK